MIDDPDYYMETRLYQLPGKTSRKRSFCAICEFNSSGKEGT